MPGKIYATVHLIYRYRYLIYIIVLFSNSLLHILYSAVVIHAGDDDPTHLGFYTDPITGQIHPRKEFDPVDPVDPEAARRPSGPDSLDMSYRPLKSSTERAIYNSIKLFLKWNFSERRKNNYSNYKEYKKAYKK